MKKLLIILMVCVGVLVGYSKTPKAQTSKKSTTTTIRLTCENSRKGIRNIKTNFGGTYSNVDLHYIKSDYLIVPKGKILKFKRLENNSKKIMFKDIAILVFDKNGRKRGEYDPRKTGEFTVYEGEKVQAYINIVPTNSEEPEIMDVTFHFKEMDKSLD